MIAGMAAATERRGVEGLALSAIFPIIGDPSLLVFLVS